MNLNITYIYWYRGSIKSGRVVLVIIGFVLEALVVLGFGGRKIKVVYWRFSFGFKIFVF